MGSNYTPDPVGSGFQTETNLNNELQKLRLDLIDKVDREGVGPNAMNADFDLGDNQLLNVAEGVLGTDGVNLNQVTNLATSIATNVLGVGQQQGQTTGDPITINFGVATGSQGTATRTVFDLNSLFGVTSLIGLTVTVNGVVQIPGAAYSVSSTTVTFVSSLDPDSDIMFIYGDLSPTPTISLTVNNYDIATFIDGSPGASQEVMRMVAVRDILFTDDFASSRLDAETAATASTVFDIKVDGVDVGDITVAASGTTGTFTTDAGDLTVNAGEVLSIVAPASPDATLADVSITLFGARA